VELERGRDIAREIVYWLTPACERIVIAGGIRRRKPNVGDIELLCIPKFVDGVDELDRTIMTLVAQGLLDFRRNRLGYQVYGPKNKLMVHLPSGVGVDIFSTTPERWAVSLVVRTGGVRTNRQIATVALSKGWRFRAYGDGFDTPEGHIHCSSEREVFEFVGLPYLEPWERE
jgi:DNA polymerase/3'-5' exonuclease PolX